MRIFRGYLDTVVQFIKLFPEINEKYPPPSVDQLQWQPQQQLKTTKYFINNFFLNMKYFCRSYNIKTQLKGPKSPY